MDVWSSSAVPVGTLWWKAPDPRLTVIAKMTLSFRAGTLVLAEEQEPLYTAVPSAIGVAEELQHPEDFVPYKPRCDVLLVGSAWAATPCSVIPFWFRVGPLERLVYALAGRPVNAIPLSSKYLRRSPSGGEAVAVGPLSTHHPDRAGFVQAKIPARAAALEREILPPGVDLGWFNTAAVAQRMDAISAGMHMVVPWFGIAPAECACHIPAFHPQIFIPDPANPRSHRKVPLGCDTILIDIDRAKCVLTFRGTIPRDPRVGFPSHLVAVVASSVDLSFPGALEAMLAKASVRRSLEPADVEARLGRASADTPALTAPGMGARSSPHAVTTSNFPSDADGTETLLPQGGVTAPVLPFAPSPAGDRTSSAPAPSPQRAEDASERETLLPSSKAAEDADAVETHLSLPGVVAPVLPFVTRGAAEAVVGPPLAAEPPSRAIAPDAAEDDGAQVIIALETFAAIKVALWSGVALREALARHSVDPRTYHLYERRQASALGEDAARGKLERARALQSALRGARERSNPPPIDIEHL